MKHLLNFKKNSNLHFFLKYFVLFMLLFISLAMAALFVLLKEQGDPFFYIKF